MLWIEQARHDVPMSCAAWMRHVSFQGIEVSEARGAKQTSKHIHTYIYVAGTFGAYSSKTLYIHNITPSTNTIINIQHYTPAQYQNDESYMDTIAEKRSLSNIQLCFLQLSNKIH